MAKSTNIPKIPQINQQIKIKQDLPNTIKLASNNFSQNSTHLSKNPINNLTTLESRPRQQKIFDERIIFQMLFSQTVDILKITILNLFIQFFFLFRLLLIFFIDTFEALIILLIIFCNIFLIFYSLFEIYLQLSQIIDHIHRYDNSNSI